MKGWQVSRGTVEAWQLQSIRQVTCLQATLMWVRRGEKRLWLDQRQYTAAADQLIMVPGGMTLDLQNHPGPQGYLCELLQLDNELLRKFVETYADEVQAARAHAPALCAPMDESMKQLWQALFDGLGGGEDARLSEHRALGLLLAITLSGAGSVLFSRQGEQLSERIRNLLLLQPGKDWRVEDVARHVGMGQSTLRRKLEAEGVSFRALLDQVRLNSALGLVQNSRQPIGAIANLCGYESASRFTQRFQAHFGVKPSQLRQM